MNLRKKLLSDSFFAFKTWVGNDLRNFKAEIPQLMDMSFVLFYAIDKRDMTAFQYGIDEGANLNYLHPDKNKTVAMYAILKNESIAKEIFKQHSEKIRFEIKDEKNKTALHYAIEKRSLLAVIIFNITNNEIALHMFESVKKMSIIKF